MKIPGLAHEVNVKLEDGIHQILLSLRGDVIAGTPIRSRSETGIMKALVEVAKKAEIAHQIPESIFGDLAKRLTTESGYLELLEGESGGERAISGYVEFPPEVEEKLNLIILKIENLEKKIDELKKN